MAKLQAKAEKKAQREAVCVKIFFIYDCLIIEKLNKEGRKCERFLFFSIFSSFVWLIFCFTDIIFLNSNADQ